MNALVPSTRTSPFGVERYKKKHNFFFHSFSLHVNVMQAKSGGMQKYQMQDREKSKENYNVPVDDGKKYNRKKYDRQTLTK